MVEVKLRENINGKRLYLQINVPYESLYLRINLNALNTSAYRQRECTLNKPQSSVFYSKPQSSHPRAHTPHIFIVGEREKHYHNNLSCNTVQKEYSHY